MQKILSGQFDNKRFKLSFRSPVDGHDLSAAWSGKVDPLVFLVGKKELTGFDQITLFDLHGRFHADVIIADKGDMADCIARAHFLFRTAGHREIQSLCDLNGLHIRQRTRWCWRG